MKVLLLSLVVTNFFVGTDAFGISLDVLYSKDMRPEHQRVLVPVMEEVASFLPKKFIEQLPNNIEIKVANLSNHTTIPEEVCIVKTKEEVKADKKIIPKRSFIYGAYNQYNNTLTINTPVLLELKKGQVNSKRINCQHKSLYDQALATIVHELTHAYDFKNGRVSNSMEYIRRAGFKKGLLKIKNKNISAMRSADAYELVNIAESFAVNMEYFAMDPEFMCRKPSMFDYFKRLFDVDPFPTRKCNVNNTVMISSGGSYFPTDLDASRVYRIDYLLASAGKDAMSGFGHSMFRIVMCAPEHVDVMTQRVIPATPFGKKCLEDKFYHIVVSYRASVEDAKLSYIKGVTGGYPSMLFLLSFSDVLDEYNRDELRDVVSYPLKLSPKEREDFITKVKEEHWNYRGAYKFINNNCAVESYDLLKSSLESSQLNVKGSLTPNGVLEDLDKMEFLSISDKQVETYKAQTDQVILAYKSAYNYKGKNDKADKEAVLKFIETSKIEERLNRFKQFAKTTVPNSDLNAQLHFIKERLIAASSFSVMEQQIFRTVSLKLKKVVGEKLMNTEDPQVKKLINSAKTALGKNIIDLSEKGYGIPFKDEMVSQDEVKSNLEDSAETIKKIDQIIRSFMPIEFAQLDKMEENIKIFNTYSLEIRKEYRKQLEIYIHQVLKNLTREDFTRDILVQAAQNDVESLKKVRELLGKNLVTEKEILDAKLKKLIQNLL
jgi:hypothetical protein